MKVRLEDIYFGKLNDSNNEEYLEKKDVEVKKDKTLFSIQTPIYLMNYPFTVSNDVKNNVFMKESNESINLRLIYGQFQNLYSFMASTAIVYLLPSEKDFQDLPYVANIGMVLPHLEKVFVASNYSSKVRQGEEDIAKEFFRMMRYTVYESPFKWEGEAELKWLKDNVYVGGYGLRSEIQAFEWFEEKFDMKVIKVKLKDSRFYHLDCALFSLDSENILLRTNIFTPMEVKEIEKYVNIIDVPSNVVTEDVTNCVRFYDYVLCPDPYSEVSDKESKIKAIETVSFLEKTCSKFNLEPRFFNISEFGKSGASLSCLVLNMNFMSYKIPLY